MLKQNVTIYTEAIYNEELTDVIPGENGNNLLHSYHISFGLCVGHSYTNLICRFLNDYSHEPKVRTFRLCAS